MANLETISCNIPMDFDFIAGDRTPVTVGSETGWRLLPFHVLINLIGGTSRVERQGQPTFFADSRDSYLIRRNTPHRLTTLGGTEPVSLWSHFRVTIFQSVDLFDFYDFPPRFSPELNRELQEITLRLIAPSAADRLARLLDRKRCGLELVAALLREAPPRPEQQQRLSLLTRLAPALEFIARHAGETLTLAQIAARMNLSPSRFSALFQAALGCSPLTHHRNLRMMRAHELLVNHAMPFEVIAAELGFYDVFHFSKQFKQHFGVSPRDYLRYYRQQQEKKNA